MGVFRRFGSDQSGATALMFGFALLPLMGVVGAAVDYGRAAAIHSKLQRAVDAAAFTLVKEPKTASVADLQDRATKLVGGLLSDQDKAYVTLGAVTVTKGTSSVTVSGRATVQNAFMQVAGFKQTDVGVTSTSTWGTQKIELALVLDNTGSMNDTISGKRKIDALKSAALTLLSDLRDAARDADAVKVSIVPFDTEVRFDTATYATKGWFAWQGGATPMTWTGYVYDRFGSYATSDAAPTMSIPDSLVPAPKASQYGQALAPMRPLTSVYDYFAYTSLQGVVNGMQPRGNTNIALGAMWGITTLTPSEPFTEGAPMSDTSVKKFMVVLTDGDNTMNHINGVPSTNVNDINAKTSTACSLAKTTGIEVFTIKLLAGNATLLSGCASGPTPISDQHYFDVQSDAQLKAAFKSITDAITKTRLTS